MYVCMYVCMYIILHKITFSLVILNVLQMYSYQ